MEETENSLQECSDNYNSNNEISHFQDYLYNGTFSNQSKKSASAQAAGIMRSRMDASSTSRFDANILQKEIRIINGGSNSDQFDDESEIDNRNQGFQGGLIQPSSNESKGNDQQLQQQLQSHKQIYNNYISMDDENLLQEQSSNENEERRQTSNFATMQNDFCNDQYFNPAKLQEVKMDKSQLGPIMTKSKAFKTIERNDYQISSNASQTDQAVMKKLYDKCQKLTEINQTLEAKTKQLHKVNQRITESCNKTQEENATLKQRLHKLTLELNSVKEQLLKRDNNQQYSASTICQNCNNDKLTLNPDKYTSKYRNEQLYKMVLILEQEKADLQDKNLALLQRQISQRCDNLNYQERSRARSRAIEQHQFDSIEERYNNKSLFKERKRAMTSDSVIRVDLDQLTQGVAQQDGIKNDKKSLLSNSSIDVSARKNKPPLEFKYNELCDKFTSILQENQQLRKIKQTASNSSYGRNNNDSPAKSCRDSSSAAAPDRHSIHVNQMFSNNHINEDNNNPLNKRSFTYINPSNMRKIGYFADNQDLLLCQSHSINDVNKEKTKNTLEQLIPGESNLCSGIRREDYSYLPQKYMNLAKKKKLKGNKDENQKKKETIHSNNHAIQMKENTYQNKDNCRECIACSKDQKDISKDKINSNTRQSSTNYNNNNNSKTISVSMKSSAANTGKITYKTKKQANSKEPKQGSKSTIQEKEENKFSKQYCGVQNAPASIKARKTQLFSHLRV